MEINVSQLLKASIGTIREFSMDEPIAILEKDQESHVVGKIKLTKTHRGILSQGMVETTVPLECSRCLKAFKSKLTVNIEEEYFPSLDINSGTALEQPDDPGSFIIDEHHILDLSEAIRQNALLAIPMKPLCREDCLGLCPVCGKDLNKKLCECNKVKIDPRWAQLAQLTTAGNKYNKNKKETE
jgi:uncharacterized protein